MSAEIINFIPRPNPNRQRELDRQAIEIANECFPSVICNPVLYGGEGIDGMYPAPESPDQIA